MLTLLSACRKRRIKCGEEKPVPFSVAIPRISFTDLSITDLQELRQIEA